MRHGMFNKKLNRTSEHRKALLKNMLNSGSVETSFTGASTGSSKFTNILSWSWKILAE